MLTPNKQRALQALLTQPTKADAAKAAGVTPRTLSDYFNDAEFQQAYKSMFAEIVNDATRQAQQSLNPALAALRDIVENPNEAAAARISAARSLLEYGLKLTELNDILRDLEQVEPDVF